MLAVLENTPLRERHVGGDARILRVSAQDWSHFGLSLGFSIACGLAHEPLEEPSGLFIHRTWKQPRSLDLPL